MYSCCKYTSQKNNKHKQFSPGSVGIRTIQYVDKTVDQSWVDQSISIIFPPFNII